VHIFPFLFGLRSCRICCPSVVKDNRLGLIMHGHWTSLLCLILLLGVIYFFLFLPFSFFQKWKPLLKWPKQCSNGCFTYVIQYRISELSRTVHAVSESKNIKEKFREHVGLVCHFDMLENAHFEARNSPNCIFRPGSADPLGKLTALSRPPACMKGGGAGDGNEKREKEKEPQVAKRKREIKGKGGGWGRN